MDNNCFRYKFFSFNVYLIISLMLIIGLFFVAKNEIEASRINASYELTIETQISYIFMMLFLVALVYFGSGKILISQDGITVKFWLNQKLLRWDKIKRVKRMWSFAGYNRVLYSDEGKIMFPEFVENISELENIIESRTSLSFRYDTLGFKHDN